MGDGEARIMMRDRVTNCAESLGINIRGGNLGYAGENSLPIHFKGLWWHKIFSHECMQSFGLRKQQNFLTLGKISSLRDEIEEMST